MSEASDRPRCLVADDHPAVVFAICNFLSGNGFDVAGTASDGQHAVTLAAGMTPDLALLDLRMPRLGGSELVRQVKGASPGTAVVVYTADADESVAHEALDAGAVAIVLKEAPLADLTRALESALAGSLYLDPGLGGSMGADLLTARELDVLQLLAEGLPNEQIGNRLGITVDTVRSHLRKASRRLGADSRTQAVAKALRLGLIA